MPSKSPGDFLDSAVPVRLKLACLWTSVVLLYLYGDYFQLYQPNKLSAMLAGRTDIGPTTQVALLGMAAMLALPALMVFLCVVLPVRLNRWLNVVAGLLYSGIMILAVQGAWRFYVFYGALEVTLTLAAAWLAWSWPRQAGVVVSGQES